MDMHTVQQQQFPQFHTILFLLLPLLLLLLQLGFFQRQNRRDEDEQTANGKVAEER